MDTPTGRRRLRLGTTKLMTSPTVSHQHRARRCFITPRYTTCYLTNNFFYIKSDCVQKSYQIRNKCCSLCGQRRRKWVVGTPCVALAAMMKRRRTLKVPYWKRFTSATTDLGMRLIPKMAFVCRLPNPGLKKCPVHTGGNRNATNLLFVFLNFCCLCVNGTRHAVFYL
jgi:hypothetical protein